MNLELLHQRIQDPASIQAAEIASMHELTQKYPFAQIFSILYLKALANNQDLKLEEMIGQHAFRITDRSKLHDLLYAVHEQQQGSTEPIPTFEEGMEVFVEEEQVNELVEPESETLEFIPENAPEQVAVEPTLEDKVEIEIPEEEELDQEHEPGQGELPVEDELEKELLSHAMASAYSLELEIQAKVDEPEEDQEKTETEVEDIQQARSFTSWLKAGQKSADSATSKNPQQEKSKQLIEQFIKEEPIIGNITSRQAEKEAQSEKEKTEFYSAPKKAKESISEEKLIYSETLANIFVLQGNYPKAIIAFEQLMLTNPEKKLYFAQKIKDLNKKLNS